MIPRQCSCPFRQMRTSHVAVMSPLLEGVDDDAKGDVDGDPEVDDDDVPSSCLLYLPCTSHMTWRMRVRGCHVAPYSHPVGTMGVVAALVASDRNSQQNGDGEWVVVVRPAWKNIK